MSNKLRSDSYTTSILQNCSVNINSLFLPRIVLCKYYRSWIQFLRNFYFFFNNYWTLLRWLSLKKWQNLLELFLNHSAWCTDSIENTATLCWRIASIRDSWNTSVKFHELFFSDVQIPVSRKLLQALKENFKYNFVNNYTDI